MANQTASKASESPSDAAITEAADSVVAESISKVGPTDVVSVPKSGTPVIRYIGMRNDYIGPKGSHREITLTQFKEAGVAKPFVDGRTSVMWSPANDYQIATSVFTESALRILGSQDDLEASVAE